MIKQPDVFQYNETSILVKFDEKINENLLVFLLQLKENLISNSPKQILNVNNTYDSLLIIYVCTINNFYDVKSKILKQILSLKVENKNEPSVKKIPVCYDKKFALDFEEVSKETGLEFTEIVRRHTQAKYSVYFIGFLPGFPYMGGMDSSLFCRRKSVPRSKIESGSVGIAGNQTGIYPSNSPGGWQIIGKTPVHLFDIENMKSPSLISAGDFVMFESISKEEFEYLQSHPEELKI